MSSLGRVTLGSWVVVFGAWLAHLAGHPLPLAIDRLFAVAAGLATAAWVARELLLRIRKARAGDLLALGLPVIVLLSLALRLAGLDHEIADRTWADEGTYARHASEINAGQVVRDSFVYPHLLYYAGAFSIWLAALFAEPLLAASREWLAIGDWSTLCRLVLRVLVALTGALAVIPVARIAARIARPPVAPRTAGLVAALALALATAWDEGSHLAICDVPAAALAACCLAACARALDESHSRVWLAAGASAGLAAAAKYPAGLVAIAIIALAVREARVSPRRALGRLALAGTTAIGVFLATNPSLLVLPEMAFTGERGILFGAIQYAGEGWLGVVPEHPLRFYGSLVLATFGALALAVAAVGLVFAPRPTLVRLAWLAAFPLAYTGLLATMTVAVERNVYPLLPPLAAFVGVGVASLTRRLTGDGATRGAPLATLLLFVAFAEPTYRSAMQAVSYLRPNTREVARAWLLEHLAPGLTVLREEYAPELPPEALATARIRGRFAGAVPPVVLSERGIDVVVLAAPAWARFFASAELSAEDATIRRGYEWLFAELPQLYRIDPSATRRGPRVDVLLVPAGLRGARDDVSLAAAGLFVPDGAMHEGQAVVFRNPGQWLVASLPLTAGKRVVVIDGQVVSPRLSATDRQRRALGAATGDRLELDLPADDVVVVRLEAQVGSRVRRVFAAPAATP